MSLPTRVSVVNLLRVRMGGCRLTAKMADKALTSAREDLPLEKLLDAKTLNALSPTEKVELRKRHVERLAEQGDHAGVDPNQVSEATHVGLVMARRAVFQSIASMGLPALTIHSIVKYSGRAMKDVKNVRLRTWGPIGLGLAAVPALPFLFDKPVEEATSWVFHTAFEAVGEPAAVGKDTAGGGQVLGEVPEKEL